MGKVLFEQNTFERSGILPYIYIYIYISIQLWNQEEQLWLDHAVEEESSQQVVFGSKTSERAFDQMFYHPVILAPLLHIRAYMYEELSS